VEPDFSSAILPVEVPSVLPVRGWLRSLVISALFSGEVSVKSLAASFTTSLKLEHNTGEVWKVRLLAGMTPALRRDEERTTVRNIVFDDQ